MLKVLVVDKTEHNALKVLGDIDLSEVEAQVIAHVDRACSAVKSKKFDIIVLGDKLTGGGDTYDVGLEIVKSNTNKHSKFVCLKLNPPRAIRLNRLLSPRSTLVDITSESEVALCADAIFAMVSGK